MQVTETSTEGLKREFRVVVPATDLSTRVNDRLTQMKDQVKINGFRPGKVPVAHLKRVYGRAVMAETIDQMVRETNAKIVTDRGFKLAMDPKITMTEDKDEIEGVIEGKADLAYTIALEVVPQITLGDFKSIKLERLITEVSEADIDDALDKIAAQNRPYAAKADGSTAESGDRVTISFVGTIDGVLFEGGSGEDVPVIIGSNSFIPGFEEQLIGIASGESRTVNVTFPPNYASEQLAGKAASFAVTAKSVESPGPVTVDDAFATSLGIESLARLRAAVKERIAMEHGAASRQKLKRALLDRLDAMHKFEAPRPWSRRSSRTSGTPCLPTSSRRTGPSRTRGRPRRKRAPNTAPLPTGACGSASSLRRSAKRTTSGWPKTKCRAAWWSGSGNIPDARRKCGTSIRRIPTPWRACGRPSSRKRWSTSWSNWPMSRKSR